MLILAATPIGNLGDATRRLVEALDAAEVVAAEDTRTAERLLRGLGVANRPRLIALHEHNERARAEELASLSVDGDVLLLSDAGMPTVSDPGYVLVQAAIAAGATVTALPGPSALLMALAVSGLPTDRFAFEGFLPRRGRLAALRGLAGEPRTLVFFESPHRLPEALRDLAEAFGPERPAAVCRELTKLHEEIARGTLAELADRFAEGTRGEVVLVVGGAPARAVSLEDGLARVREAVASGTGLKQAAAEASDLTGLSKRDLYEAALRERDPR